VAVSTCVSFCHVEVGIEPMRNFASPPTLVLPFFFSCAPFILYRWRTKLERLHTGHLHEDDVDTLQLFSPLCAESSRCVFFFVVKIETLAHSWSDANNTANNNSRCFLFSFERDHIPRMILYTMKNIPPTFLVCVWVCVPCVATFIIITIAAGCFLRSSSAVSWCGWIGGKGTWKMKGVKVFERPPSPINLLRGVGEVLCLPLSHSGRNAFAFFCMLAVRATGDPAVFFFVRTVYIISVKNEIGEAPYRTPSRRWCWYASAFFTSLRGE